MREGQNAEFQVRTEGVMELFHASFLFKQYSIHKENLRGLIFYPEVVASGSSG